MSRLSSSVLPALTALALVVPAPAAMAQSKRLTVRPASVPAVRRVDQRAIDVFNSRSTTRIFGSGSVERTTVYQGNVGVHDGSLRVSGVIEGDLVAVNADVELRPTAEVRGSVVIVGGELDRYHGARVFGGVTRQWERVRVRRVGERLQLVEAPLRRLVSVPRLSFRPRPSGEVSLIAGFDPTYNRVEGLPLRAGLALRSASGGVRTAIRGYGIFRTAGDFETREGIGYRAEGSVSASRAVGVTVGGRAFDEVRPTQDWPLERDEAGLSALLLHRDYRDYFLQRGFAGFLAIRPLRGLELTGEVARVEEASIAARDPWTPFRRDEAWRPNPTIDAGDYTLLTGTLEYGYRPARPGGGSGWFLRGTWEHGIGENVVERVLPAAVRGPLPTSDYTFDRASVDVRRYERIGWSGRLGLRAFWAGSVGPDPLPVQRRLSLGGPDPLIGFPFRAFSCADASLDPSLPGLCDHVLLFQAEYRGPLAIDWVGGVLDQRSYGKDDFGKPWDWPRFDRPVLVLFSNAGTAWLETEERGDLNVDAGFGIESGSFGLYAARGLTADHGVRLTMRIQRRF